MIEISDYEIEEIRRIRNQLSAEHGHDLNRLTDYYRQVEQELRKSNKYRFVDEERFSSEQEHTPQTAT